MATKKFPGKEFWESGGVLKTKKELEM